MICPEGRSIEAIAGANMYGACPFNGLSRLLDEVTAAARIKESRVTNRYKRLNEKLGLPARPVTPSMFVPRLASDRGPGRDPPAGADARGGFGAR